MEARPVILYQASYDSTTKTISAVFAVLLIVIAAVLRNPWVAGVSAVVLAAAYAYSPRGYALSVEGLAVRRLIGDVRIPLREIQEVRVAGADDFRGCVRLWGSGGLFGYYGRFYTSKLGNATWYVTNRRQTVVVRAGAKTWLVSPDDSAAFLAAIMDMAPLNPAPVNFASVSLPGAHRTMTAVLPGVVIAVAAVSVITAALLYSPGPPDYTLTPGALVIRDRFYPVTVAASSVDVERVRVVDVNSDPAWRPTVRTNGFANAHYRSGWFRVARGSTVRLYRADGTRLVLLPPKAGSAPVLIEVRDPSDFVRRVKQEWGAP